MLLVVFYCLTPCSPRLCVLSRPKKAQSSSQRPWHMVNFTYYFVSSRILMSLNRQQATFNCFKQCWKICFILIAWSIFIWHVVAFLCSVVCIYHMIKLSATDEEKVEDENGALTRAKSVLLPASQYDRFCSYSWHLQSVEFPILFQIGALFLICPRRYMVKSTLSMWACQQVFFVAAVSSSNRITFICLLLDLQRRRAEALHSSTDGPCNMFSPLVFHLCECQSRSHSLVECQSRSHSRSPP